MRKFFFTFTMILVGITSFAQSKGYEKSIEANGAIGLDDCQKYTFGISVVNGYRINDYFFVGAGVGYDYLEGLYYHNYEYKGSIIGHTSYDSYDVRNNIQLFGRAKANFTNTKVSPFIAVDLGYNLGLSSNEIKMAKGFFFQPSFGCDFKINSMQSIYVMLGYNGQNYEYKWFNTTYGSSGTESKKQLAGKFCIHIGFKF